MTYTGALHPEQQIDAEEWIASMIYDLQGHDGTPCEADTICEESAGELGRQILHGILARFRPDLMAFDPPMLNGCLFSGDHCPGHSPRRKFRVNFGEGWINLTETEIIDHMNETGAISFLHTSDWDHWCEGLSTPHGDHGLPEGS